MSNAQHSSTSNEHYTPHEVVAAARATMGHIHLDPASCALANESIVGADLFYSLDNPGHREHWFGNVFLNPPGGLVDMEWRPVTVKTSKRRGCSETGACGLPPGKGHKHSGVTSSAKAWWYRLIEEWHSGRVEQAIFVAFTLEFLSSAQIPGWTSPLSLPFCIPSERLKFYRPTALGVELEEGEQPTHANAIIYLPPKRDSRIWAHRFRAAFRDIGDVVIPTIVAPASSSTVLHS